MKLQDVLDVIGGSTKIIIYAGVTEHSPVFSGKMCEVTKAKWYNSVGPYLEWEVIRINTIDGAITIAV